MAKRNGMRDRGSGRKLCARLIAFQSAYGSGDAAWRRHGERARRDGPDDGSHARCDEAVVEFVSRSRALLPVDPRRPRDLATRGDASLGSDPAAALRRARPRRRAGLLCAALDGAGAIVGPARTGIRLDARRRHPARPGHRPFRRARSDVRAADHCDLCHSARRLRSLPDHLVRLVRRGAGRPHLPDERLRRPRRHHRRRARRALVADRCRPLLRRLAGGAAAADRPAGAVALPLRRAPRRCRARSTA
jgi:hypothetical protein